MSVKHIINIDYFKENRREPLLVKVEMYFIMDPDLEFFAEAQNDKFNYYREQAFEAWGGDRLTQPHYPRSQKESKRSNVKGEISEKRTVNLYDAVYFGKITEVFHSCGYGVCVRIEATAIKVNNEVKRKIKPVEVNVHISSNDGERIRLTNYPSIEAMLDANGKKYDFYEGDFAEVHISRSYTIYREVNSRYSDEPENKTELTLKHKKKKAVFKAYFADVG